MIYLPTMIQTSGADTCRHTWTIAPPARLAWMPSRSGSVMQLGLLTAAVTIGARRGIMKDPLKLWEHLAFVTIISASVVVVLTEIVRLTHYLG